jgi:hypothetical protein
MPRRRITLSLSSDLPADKAVLDFLSGLPRRTRSEIIKEILLDALETRVENPQSDLRPTANTSDLAGTDPDEIIGKLF